jgi:hypothetical protein
MTNHTQTIERDAIHTFTADEVTQLRKNIADKTLELSEKEMIKKSVSSTVAMLKATIDCQVIKVREGRELRKMLCPVVFHWKEGRKDIVHPETGAIELTTDITDNDRQQYLPMEEEKKGRGKK